jgi:hypothetical protein
MRPPRTSKTSALRAMASMPSRPRAWVVLGTMIASPDSMKRSGSILTSSNAPRSIAAGSEGSRVS